MMGGTSVYDACDVCNGDGTSCLRALTIALDMQPDSPKDIHFTHNVQYGGEFSLDDDNTSTLPNSITLHGASSNDYRVTVQGVANEYVVESIECDSDNVNVDVDQRRVIIQSGEDDVTCTFVLASKYYFCDCILSSFLINFFILRNIKQQLVLVVHQMPTMVALKTSLKINVWSLIKMVCGMKVVFVLKNNVVSFENKIKNFQEIKFYFFMQLVVLVVLPRAIAMIACHLMHVLRFKDRLMAQAPSVKKILAVKIKFNTKGHF